MMAADVAIVGGGVIGSAVAYYLTKAGARVILCERADLLSGTSGATHSNISMHNMLPGPQLDLAMWSLDLYRHLAGELPDDPEFDPCGGLVLFPTAADQAVFARKLDRQRAAGLRVGLLTAAEAKGRLPGVMNCVGAAECLDSARINVFRLVFGFCRAATAAGARILPHTPVVALKIQDGRVAGISTAIGNVAAPHVVLAAGAWSPVLAGQVGLTLPITPIRGQIAVTEPARLLPVRNICDSVADVDHTDPFAGKLAIRFVLGQTQSGNFLIGRSGARAGFDLTVDPATIGGIMRRAVRYLPFLGELNCIRTFAGVRPMTPDFLPVIGRFPSLEGLVVATGHGDKGVILAPATGCIVADLIAGRKSPVDLRPYACDRFQAAAAM